MKNLNPALERLIEKIRNHISKEHKKFVSTVAIFEARNYAAKNLPKSDEPSLKSYLTTLKGSYTSLIREVSVKLNGGIQKSLGTVNLGTSNQKIDLKKNSIEKVNEKIDHLNVDKGRIHLDGDCTTYQKYRSLLILFAIGEILWTVAAFLKLGDIVLIALCLGVVIGAAQISAVKTATQIIKEVEDRRKQKLYTILACISFFIFSLAIGLLRYWFVHTSTGQSVPFIVMNPFTFVAINMLFIIATALIVFFFYPTKEDMIKIHMIEAIDKEIQKLVKAKYTLESELYELLSEREYLMELRVKIDHSEKMLHKKIEANYEEAIGVFKHENTLKRTDGIFPLSFKSSHEPLPNFESNNLFSVT